MPVSTPDSPHAFIAEGQALSVVSFDDDAAAAATEALQDRSLNLALRRRKVRSEVLRIPLDANEATKAFLTDVVAALKGRRIVVVARNFRDYPEMFALAERLCDLAEAACVVAIAAPDLHISQAETHLHILDDSRDLIEFVADALVGRSLG